MGDRMTLETRLLRCARWRWMQGMAWTLNGGTVRGRVHCDTTGLEGALPDLADAATRGCLLALVREAYPAHVVCTRREPPHLHWLPWSALTLRDGRWEAQVAATEEELLVQLLEVAP